MYLSCTGIQVKQLFWGQCNEFQSLEVTRTKAEVTPERGGPSNVVAIRISDIGILYIRGNSRDIYLLHS